MDASWYMQIEIFNGIFLAVIAAVPIIVLLVTRRRDWGLRRVSQASMRAGLPIGSEDMARSLAARSRSILRANMWGLLVALAVAASLFLLTPLRRDPSFLWLLNVMILLGVLTISTTVVTVRERLFRPVPTAPRIARMTSVSVGDYLGAWRRLIPPVLLASGAVMTAALVAATVSGSARGVDAVWGIVMLASAALVVVAARWAEARVLAQPQPASDTLELAWDDLFRTDALSNLRMAQAMAAWIPLAWAATRLLETWVFPLSMGELFFPWWGIPFIQVVYTVGAGMLSTRLHPALRDAATPRASA